MLIALINSLFDCGAVTNAATAHGTQNKILNGEHKDEEEEEEKELKWTIKFEHFVWNVCLECQTPIDNLIRRHIGIRNQGTEKFNCVLIDCLRLFCLCLCVGTESNGKHGNHFHWVLIANAIFLNESESFSLLDTFCFHVTLVGVAHWNCRAF